ncbi:hypothetical protein GJAV_G00101890 [Gymnothorax javanicus]|nr:hypothetical protein GJAV_G00101890 [Gymnothorax javanicus]
MWRCIVIHEDEVWGVFLVMRDDDGIYDVSQVRLSRNSSINDDQFGFGCTADACPDYCTPSPKPLSRDHFGLNITLIPTSPRALTAIISVRDTEMTRVLPITALVLVCLACMTQGGQVFEKPVQDAPDEGGLQTALQTAKEKLQEAGAYMEASYHEHIKPALERSGAWFRETWDRLTTKAEDSSTKDEKQ